MNVRLLEIAQRELDEAIEHYNGEEPGLGDAFLVETLAAIERIRRFPDGWHPMSLTRRRPGYWRDRIL